MIIECSLDYVVASEKLCTILRKKLLKVTPDKDI